MVLCSLQIIHKKTNVSQARCLVNYLAIKERLGKKKDKSKEQETEFPRQSKLQRFCNRLGSQRTHPAWYEETKMCNLDAQKVLYSRYY